VGYYREKSMGQDNLAGCPSPLRRSMTYKEEERRIRDWGAEGDRRKREGRAWQEKEDWTTKANHGNWSTREEQVRTRKKRKTRSKPTA